ncbi:hypothetical protein [Mesorhizobium atlanticum]|uniref:Uncharacterized protein n=1 Tax=Mesorhizobium atlanticum TaxID=2233532 RepID=A0A330GW73_9HYPH|nr:hypothetical protein [Mesorhizobium atlanticum]RAZ78675.1 hypothetical protein DPM35_09040 [Mesorhizobium atlanticum]
MTADVPQSLETPQLAFRPLGAERTCQGIAPTKGKFAPLGERIRSRGLPAREKIPKQAAELE